MGNKGDAQLIKRSTDMYKREKDITEKPGKLNRISTTSCTPRILIFTNAEMLRGKPGPLASIIEMATRLPAC